MGDCFIYARVSTERQKEEGFSIPAQLELLREYAKRQGLKIAREYTEAETAGKAGRFQFDAMLDALAKKGAPGIILVEKTDRLTRNFKDYIRVDEVIQAHGVEFHLVKEGEIWGQNAPSSQKLIQGVRVVMAKHYLDNLREEIKKGINQRIKQGLWCAKAPFGYRMDNESMLRVVPDRALFVQKAFEYYATGTVSLESLGKRLHREGVFYQPHKPKIPKPTLFKMLTNPVYIAEIHHCGVIYPAVHDPLVDRSTWLQVQAMLTGKSHPKTDREFAYKGLLTCGTCGSTMNGELKKGGRYVYYRCWKAANGQCAEHYINETVIDKALGDLFNRMVFPSEFRTAIMAEMRKLAGVKKMTEQEEMTRINREKLRLKDRLENAYMDHQDGVISREFFLQLQQRHSDQMAQLNAAYERMDKAEIDFYELADWYFALPELLARRWSSYNASEKWVIAKNVTSNLRVKNKSVDVELVSTFDALIKRPKSVDSGLWWSNIDELRTFLCNNAVTIEAVYRALAA